MGRSGRPVRRPGRVGPRSGGRDGGGDRALAAVQRRAPDAPDDRGRPALAGGLARERRRLRRVASRRLGPERPDDQQRWNLYGRVAPWADCTKFTPPPGTRALCEATPPSQRGYPLPGRSDLARANTTSTAPNPRPTGCSAPPTSSPRYPHAMGLLQKWSEAAILGQPLDYLHAVWLDTIRLVRSQPPLLRGSTRPMN